ncbi:EAL domain-containing protein [Robbsia sp. KACC 23696]|uniref:bifunctional diguanylate cyclase/phosphodiesterase n=1 Tax=Robbsia sp. KACC 23696 TaxID=3149231 RepID=UPI00325A56BB
MTELQPPGDGASRPFDPQYDDHRDTRKWALFAIPALGIVLLAILWSVIGTRLSVEHRSVSADSAASADILASALEQHTVKAIHQIDQITRFIKFEFEKDPAHFNLDLAFSQGLVPPDVLLQVSLIDANGKMLEAVSTRPGQRGITVTSGAKTPVDVSDREHFRYHVTHDNDELFISKPVLGRASGQWTLQFTRRLNDAANQFDGIVVVSVDPRYFTSDFYNTAALGESGVIAVISDDGTVLSRQTGNHDPEHRFTAGVRYPEPQHLSGQIEDPVDNVARIVAYRHIVGYPLGIMAGLAVNDELAAFNHTRNVYLMMTAFISAAIIVFLFYVWLLMRKLMQREQEMRLLAETDILTGLPNRYQSLRMLRREVLPLENVGRIALLMVGLDNFKTINDSLGHGAGDQVLIKTAGRLGDLSARLSSEVLILARSGGDAFLIAIKGPAVREESALLAEAIAEALQPPFTVRGIPLVLNASVGIALYMENGENEADLLKKADLAMYSAKEAGKACYQFYSPHLARRADRLMKWEQQLRVALSQKQFFVEYQPIFNLQDRRIVGFETLLRWHHPDQGLILAGDFIPIAESTGLILPLGDFALDAACSQLSLWRAQGFEALTLAVNVSSVQFWRGDLVDTVRRALDKYNVPPGQLELEITETAMIEYPELVSDKITALKALGVRIALDDFGTGYSSLSYLHRFPVDTLKIDRSFVHAIPNDRSVCSMISAIVGLAKSLGLTVVVEGIENDEQAEWLSRLGSLDAQGFLFSRPLRAEAALEALRHIGISGTELPGPATDAAASPEVSDAPKKA